MIIRDKLLECAASSQHREHLDSFSASPDWTLSFTKRNSLTCIRLHCKGGIVCIAEFAAGMMELREKLHGYEAENILNVDETCFLFRMLPRRSYVFSSENGKTIWGAKNMKTKIRFPFYVCKNAAGTAKVSLAKNGNPVNPRRFCNRTPTIAYFNQRNA